MVASARGIQWISGIDKVRERWRTSYIAEAYIRLRSDGPGPKTYRFPKRADRSAKGAGRLRVEQPMESKCRAHDQWQSIQRQGLTSEQVEKGIS